MLTIHGIQGRLLRPPAGLLFGLEGILFDDTPWRHWLFRVLGRLGIRADYHALCRVWDARCAPAVNRGELSVGEAFHRLLSSLGLRPAQVEELELACLAQWRRHHQQAQLLPGVKKTLTQLQDDGVAMGLLTDAECPGLEVEQRLEGCGLQHLFVSVLSSVDVGQTKPHPIGYLRSAQALQVDVQKVAFVGRSAEELTGASAAGMQTIALNHKRPVEADVCLGRFEQLLELFDHRGRYAAAG